MFLGGGFFLKKDLKKDQKKAGTMTVVLCLTRSSNKLPLRLLRLARDRKRALAPHHHDAISVAGNGIAPAPIHIDCIRAIRVFQTRRRSADVREHGFERQHVLQIVCLEREGRAAVGSVGVVDAEEFADVVHDGEGGARSIGIGEADDSGLGHQVFCAWLAGEETKFGLLVHVFGVEGPWCVPNV